MPPNRLSIRLSYSVPYAAQVASPELARAIFAGGLDPIRDPRWAESGARDPQEYAYWTSRACGVACVKMCVEALGGPWRPLIDWARAGVAIDGYLVEKDGRGGSPERGWLHRALADLIQAEGFSAGAKPLTLDRFPAYLSQNRMIIASVSFELGDETLPVTHRGGHLVVVTGVDLLDGALEAVVIHNPSGRSAALRENAVIPVERFAAAYGGKAIVVGAM